MKSAVLERPSLYLLVDWSLEFTESFFQTGIDVVYYCCWQSQDPDFTVHLLVHESQGDAAVNALSGICVIY